MNKDGLRIRKPRRQYPIEVVLPARPRPYVRGDGPALAPLRIAFKNDSTAYIVWKAVWPDWSTTGRVREQLFYVVCWPELPAASLAVPANEILDYVSPRTLEDYEYACSLERDEAEKEFILQEKRARAQSAERAAAKEAERAARDVLQAMKASAATAATSATITSIGPPKKKRGRPSKADLMVRQSFKNEIQDVPLQSASIEIAIPSLSTPQKPVGGITGDLVAEDSEESDDKVPHIPSSSVAKSTHIKPFSRSPSLGVPGTYMIDQAEQKHDDPAPSTASFTPVARSAGTWPSQSRSEARAGESSVPGAVDSPAKSTRKRKRNTSGKVSRGEEPQYVVERLEDEQYVDLKDGKPPVRVFLVRWEGDWPPEQNPTWEPEVYLPKKLVKSYLKRKAAKVKEAKLNKPGKSHSVPALPKYSSVAEAFEGDIEEVPQQPLRLDHEEGDDDEADEMLLVEECDKNSEFPERRLPKPNGNPFGGVRPILGFNGTGNGY